MSRIIESCQQCKNYYKDDDDEMYCWREDQSLGVSRTIDGKTIPDFCPLPIPNYEQAWNELKSQLQRDKDAGMGYKVSRALFLMEEAEEKHENH